MGFADEAVDDVVAGRKTPNTREHVFNRRPSDTGNHCRNEKTAAIAWRKGLTRICPLFQFAVI